MIQIQIQIQNLSGPSLLLLLSMMRALKGRSPLYSSSKVVHRYHRLQWIRLKQQQQQGRSSSSSSSTFVLSPPPPLLLLLLLCCCSRFRQSYCLLVLLVFFFFFAIVLFNKVVDRNNDMGERLQKIIILWDSIFQKNAKNQRFTIQNQKRRVTPE